MKLFPVKFLAILWLLAFAACNQTPKHTGSQEQTETIDETLDKLNEKINANPNDEHLYIERANYFMTNEDINNALRDIIFAIDINDQNPDHYITLSEAYLALGNPDLCLEGLEKALEIDPKNQEAFLKKAQLYLIMHEYDKTYETLRELLNIDSYNPTAYYIRGFGLLEQGDTASAVRSFITAIDQKQDYFEAHLQIGIIYARQSNPLAVDYLSNAIDIKPELPEPYYQLGFYYQENNQLSLAVSTYNLLLSMIPDYTFAIYNLGYINLVYLQRYESAVEYFTQVIGLDPGQYDAFYNRGYSYELMKKKELARSDYQKALELRTNYQLAIDGLNRLD